MTVRTKTSHLLSQRFRASAGLLIIVFAVIIHAPYYFWGIPLLPDQGYYAPMEVFHFFTTALFPEKYLSCGYCPEYGMLVTTIAGLILLPIKGALLVLGKLPPTLDYNGAYLLLVAGVSRGVAFAMGVATIYVVFLLTDTLTRSRVVAFGAALLLTLSPLFGLYATFALGEGPMAFMVMLCFYLLYLHMQKPSLGSVVLLGLASGCLLSTKISSVFFIIFPLATFFWDGIALKKNHKNTALYALLYLTSCYLSMSLTSPLMANPLHYYAYLQKSYLDEPFSFTLPITIKILPFLLRRFTFAFNSASIVIISLVALFFSCPEKQAKRVFFMMAGYVLCTLLFWKWRLSRHYIVPFIPIISIFFVISIRGFCQLFFHKNNRAGTMFFSVLIGCLSLYLFFFQVVPTEYLMLFKEQRTLTWRFLTTRYPQGTKLYYFTLRAPLRNAPDLFVEKELPPPRPANYFVMTADPGQADVIVLSKKAQSIAEDSLDRKSWAAPYTLSETFKKTVYARWVFSPEKLMFYELNFLKNYSLVYDTDRQYSAFEKKNMPFYSALMVWEKKRRP